MECSLAYRAPSKKKGLLREWKPSTDWELKNSSLAPHQEWDQQVGPTMTSPSLQSLQAPSGMPLSSQLSTLPSYSQQTLPKAMRGHQSSPSGIISNHSHAQNFSLDTPLWTQPFTLQPIFVFSPEEAAFTPAQALQLACVQAAGLYLHITFKAFIWQAVWKMPECNINLHFSHHSPFLISVWECINKGLSHKVCIWAFLMFGGAELAPEPGAVTPSSCSTWKPVYSSDSPSQNSLFCLNIQSSGFLYPAFPTLSHQTVIWSRYWNCSETTSISSLTDVFAFRQWCNKKGVMIVGELNSIKSLCSHFRNEYMSNLLLSFICMNDR